MPLKVKKLFFGVILIILFAAVFAGGVYVGKNQVTCKVCKPETLDFSLFWDAYDKLKTNYINPEEIKTQEIMYGAISGMVNSLGDPHTTFFNPEEAKLFQQDLQGSFEGIGVEVGIKKGQFTIITPLEGTPGEKAGLRPGDQVIRIDEKSTSEMSLDEGIRLIRGKKGTTVVLTIFREGWTETKDVAIVRGTIKVKAIDWELKNGNIAYIQIRQFDRSLSGDFKKVALEILSSPAQKIILDLRNDPGGYLEVSQEIAGWFLQQGQIVTIEDFGKSQDPENYLAQGNARLLPYPMVVLINGGSASAAEILAGALRDNRGITLIGEKSFGKGSVQEAQYLSDGKSLIKVTVAKWLTPKGASISDVGLTPDVKVEISETDIEADKDPQLEKALEIINNL